MSILTLVFAPSTYAQIVTWNGSAGTGAWATAANWDSDPALPATTDVATFDAANANSQFSITLGANRTINGLDFLSTGANGFTFNSGSQLTLGAGGITNRNSATQTFSSDVRINSNQTWAATSGDLDFNNVLINRNLVLTGANNIDFAGTLTMQNSRIITNDSTGVFTINNIDLSATTNRLLTLTGTEDTSITGLISNAGRIRKRGTGTLTVSGANTYTGDTILNGGTVVIGDNASFGTSRIDFNNITLDGGGVARHIANESRLLNTLRFGGTSDIELSGNMTLTNNRNIYADGTGAYEISGDIALSNNTNNRTLIVRGANDMTISGDISNGASATAGRLTKNDAGTVTLTGTNTYDGTTDVNAGILVITGDNSGLSGQFRLDNGDVQVGAANAFGTGELRLAAGDIRGDGIARTITNDITLAGSGTIIKGSSDLTFTGTTTLNGNRVLNVTNTGLTTLGNIDLSNTTSNRTLTLTHAAGSDVVIDGVISNSASSASRLTKNGTGTLTLTGDNTFTGVTVINAGTVNVGNGGTTGSLTGNITNRAALRYNRADTLIQSGRISNSGSVTQAGSGTTIFTAANNYTGGTTISAGTLQLGNGGTTGSFTGNVTNNAALRYNRSNNFNFSSDISGTGTVTTDAGQLTLSGTNSCGGDTTVNSGSTLVLSADDALGSGGATTANSGGTLALQGNIRDANQTLVTIGGTGNSSAGAIQNSSGVNTLSADVDLSADTTITSNAGTLNFGLQSAGDSTYLSKSIDLGTNILTVDTDAGATVAFRYDITGTGGITKTGEGDLLLNNGWNTYTGDTNINDGKFILSPYTYSASFPANYGLTSDVIVGDNIGAANSATFQMGDGVESDPAEYIRDTQNITVNSDGYWNLQGFKETIANLSINGGTIDAQESGGTLNERLDVTGVITADVGSGSATSTINGLIGMNNDTAKSIVVNTGATLDIEANLSNGGFLKTGTGILELSGNTTFTGINSFGTLNIAGDSILDFTAGVGNDNTLNLGSLTFEAGASLTVNGWNSYGDLWTSQNFPGATLDIRDADTAKITFSDFTNDQTIWLTSDFGSKEITVPEPSSYGALFMAFALGVWSFRRKSRFQPKISAR